MSTLRVNNLQAVGGTGTITVPTGNTIGQVDQPAGLVFITSGSFSAVSSVSMPSGTFTTTYRHYQVLFNITESSADGSISLRINNNGTPRTGSGYYWQGVYRQSNGFSNGLNENNSGQWSLYGVGADEDILSATINIYEPTSTTIKTRFTHNITASTDAAFFISGVYGGFYNTAEANDGLTFVTSAGNITGSWFVYGYRS